MTSEQEKHAIVINTARLLSVVGSQERPPPQLAENAEEQTRRSATRNSTQTCNARNHPRHRIQQKC